MVDDILDIVKDTWVEEYIEIHEYTIYFRYDLFPECNPTERWDEYTRLQEDLNRFGLRLDGALFEHDCISSDLVLI